MPVDCCVIDTAKQRVTDTDLYVIRYGSDDFRVRTVKKRLDGSVKLSSESDKESVTSAMLDDLIVGRVIARFTHF